MRAVAKGDPRERREKEGLGQQSSSIRRIWRTQPKNLQVALQLKRNAFRSVFK